MEPSNSAPKNKNSFTFTFDYRFVVAALLAVILVMIVLWRPWEFRAAADARTVTVSGQAKLTAAPDEFLFMPNYEVKGQEKDVALKELSAKSDEIVKKLKELGVADSKIKTSTDGYDSPIYGIDGSGSTDIAPRAPEETTPTYTLRMTVTVNDKALAQKVQDYLVTTTPTGAVSPQVTFSENKRKELESKARDIATKEARAKAEQSAKNLGFSVGPVKSVNDDAGFGVYPGAGREFAVDEAEQTKLGLQPGENDLSYQVTVIYYLK